MSFFVRKGIHPSLLMDLSEEEFYFYKFAMEQEYDFELEKMKFWVDFWVRAFGGKSH